MSASADVTSRLRAVVPSVQFTAEDLTCLTVVHVIVPACTQAGYMGPVCYEQTAARRVS